MMRGGSHIVLRAAGRFYTPLIALFAVSLFVTRPAGEGVGFIAGLAFALLLVLHVVLHGAAAARAALPGWMARMLLALGLAGAIAAAAAPRFLYAPQLGEAGLFLVTIGAASLIVSVLVARAPTLRDEAW